MRKVSEIQADVVLMQERAPADALHAYGRLAGDVPDLLEAMGLLQVELKETLMSVVNHAVESGLHDDPLVAKLRKRIWNLLGEMKGING